MARGLQFHLALWTHAYQWTESPSANYIIDGLSAEKHPEYCRDGLSRILAEAPFVAAKECGRPVSLGLHP